MSNQVAIKNIASQVNQLYTNYANLGHCLINSSEVASDLANISMMLQSAIRQTELEAV